MDGIVLRAQTGTFAATISNPADVVKTRLIMKVNSATTVSFGMLTPYKGVEDTFERISRDEGMKTLSKGIAPCIATKALQSSMFFGTH